MKNLSVIFTLTILLLGTNVSAKNYEVQPKNYEVPPTSTTTANVPWIPDAEMEQCVKLYNEAKWLATEVSGMHVDNYNANSVNTYNAKVNQHKRMISHFNVYCAGKQSESVYKAAQKLNKKNRK